MTASPGSRFGSPTRSGATNPLDRTRQRWSVVSRIAAAVLGGYALATALSIALAGIMSGPRADAVLAATILSFTIHLAAILWAFAARCAGRAWLGLLVPTALAGALAALLT